MITPHVYNNEELFLVEGAVKDLHLARTYVNLVEQIQRPSAKKNLALGVAAALVNMHTVVATDGLLAMYDGEDAHNFAFILEGAVFAGTFKDADKLKCGDKVKAVVSKRREILYVHSLCRCSDDLFMLPLNASRGSEALFKSCMRVAWNITRVLWIVIGLVLYTYISTVYPGRGQYWFFILFTLLAPPLVMFPTEVMTYRTMRSAGLYAEAIFEAYGIPKPENFDAAEEQAMFDGLDGCFVAPHFSNSLEAHRRKFKLP